MKLIADSPTPDRIMSPTSLIPNLLVIDDDPLFQKLLEKSFSPTLNVISALSGRGGLDLLSDPNGTIDCVLLDYQLPGVDGISVLPELRKIDPKIPVIFMTGFGDLDLVKKALRLGANEYIPKPAQPEDLFQAISLWVPEVYKQLRFEQSVSRSQEQKPGNKFSAVGEGGKHIQGRIVRFGSHYVVAELSNWPKQGRILKGIEMELGRFSVFVESAGTIHEESLLSNNVKITLPGNWHVESGKSYPREKTPVFNGGVFSDNTPFGLRSAVNDLEAVLVEMHEDLEALEHHIEDWAEPGRASLQNSFIAQVENDYFPVIDVAIEQFENETSQFSACLEKEFAPMIRDTLYPLILASPFMSRVIEKPLGVSGDYGMLGQILGDPYEGHSLYSRTLNGWILNSRAAAAYRNRVDLLTHQIEQVVEQANREGRRADIMSIGSGVAYEVQRYIASHPDSRVDFNLLDYSSETLSEASRQIELCVADSKSDGVKVNFKLGTILELINQSRNGDAEPKQTRGYDLVYCTGLFDYLSDRICTEVTGYLTRLASPSGKVAVSNFTPRNPIRRFMDLVLDWRLIYRDDDHFEGILSRAQPCSNYSVFDEPGGVEVYGIIEKG